MDEPSYFSLGDMSFDLLDYEYSEYLANRSSEDSHVYQAPWTWNYSVIIVMAVFGIAANTALLMVIALNRHLLTVSNVLVGNLAVADLIMFVFAVPSDISHWLVLDWADNDLGNFLCKASGGSWSLAQALCVASLTAVSLERYCSLRWQLHAKRTAAILAVVWAFALACTVPVLVWARVVRYDRSFALCHVLPTFGWDVRAAKGVIAARFALVYLAPLLVVTGCYCGMAAILARGSPTGSAAVRARRRLAIAVLVLNVAFAVCWLPDHALVMFFFYASFDQILSVSFGVFATLREVSHVLVYVNSCLNPVVVFAISPAHRESLTRAARSCLSCGRPAAPSAGADQVPDDRYARIPEEAFLSETECADEKA